MYPGNTREYVTYLENDDVVSVYSPSNITKKGLVSPRVYIFRRFVCDDLHIIIPALNNIIINSRNEISSQPLTIFSMNPAGENKV